MSSVARMNGRMSIFLDDEQSGAYLFLRVLFGHASYCVIINFNRRSRGSSAQSSSEVFLDCILLRAVASAELLEQCKSVFDFQLPEGLNVSLVCYLDVF